MKNRLMMLPLLVLLGLGCSDDTSQNKDLGPTPDGSTGDGAVTCPKSYPFKYAGVCMPKEPSTEAKRTQCSEIVEDCDKTGKTTPDLSCITAAAPTAPKGPATVTLAGYVDVFSNGPDSDNVVVEVYDSAALIAAIVADGKAGKLKAKYFPTSVKPLNSDTVYLKWTDETKLPEDATRGKARACPMDNKLKLPCIVPQLKCGPSKVECDLKGDEYCHNGQCIERLRWESRYRIPNIPTNKYLVVRTIGTHGFKVGTWGIMAQFNIYLRADAPKCTDGEFNDCINSKGEYELEVNALYSGDYSTIPITAGLSGGVPEGHGAIAGQVHDCDDIKLSGFQVGTNPRATVMAYFNGNPVKTLPDLPQLKHGSNIDGLFAALDIVPGEVTISAVGKVGGKLLSAGTIKAAVLPDTVTVITFDGRKPAP